ncbi:patatin-like phospholipase family protein [Limnohabitans sp. G3-2]|uniref:patatin-like phospholipase family protein n=1 Tax=Limnohabitans sp. G3-2 TaxID=1100711 RepID=UPI000C1E5C96|nr:patatin-like phospholipase family protein [Limnohabitans sp. G3-2]PIT71412.1 Patatin [Limnohabitans sp. G3-2]
MPPTTGLILSGGGARAAYQVGVLAAIGRMRREAGAAPGNPFPVISGTSAGAINAAFLASNADRFDAALDELVDVWRNFQVEQVYRSDVLGMIRSGARWISLLSLGWLITQKRIRPKSLLNNDPLSALLAQRIDLQRLPALMEQGHLRALAITASSYSTGEHVTFYDSQHEVTPWVRNQRLAQHGRLSHDHLLASSAIPFIFPAMRLEGPQGNAYFGDGSMRQTAPISPAIHLGADKILVVGAGRMLEPPKKDSGEPSYPSLAHIAGHALSSIFLDSLAVDVERMQRINQTLALIPEDKRQSTHLRPVQLLLIAPSQRLDVIAAKHADALPATVKSLLRTMGASLNTLQGQGNALVSYLLFEGAYTQELMALGEADAMAQRDDIHQFFGWRAQN